MSKIETNDLIDIFKEEVTKKNKKELKKQKRQEKKLEKKLEKKENIEFERLAKKAKEKEEKKLEKKIEQKEEVDIKEVHHDKNESVFAFLYDTLFGFFLVLLLFCTAAFIGLTLYNDSSLKNVIQMSLIGVFVIFYIISMTAKKEGIKKFAAIIANGAICLEMVYTLYIA